MPKVSVIVPIYNVEKYLRECLDSLINQTLKDIEIICVNDGSFDSSPKILEEYAIKDSRIKVINKENSGYGATMNLGINNASSDYIGFLESDDIADVHMFEDLYNLITTNDCDFVKSNYFLYYSKYKKNTKNNIMKNHDINIVTNLSKDKTMIFLPASVWSSIYKKEFLNKNNIRFLQTPGASYQDTSFHYKIFLLAQRLMLTDAAYVHYRQDNENSSVNNNGKMYYITEEYKEVHKLIDTNPNLKQFEEYLCASQFIRYLWNLNRLSTDLKEEFLNYFHSEFKAYKDNGLLGEVFFKYSPKDISLFFNSPQKYFKKHLKKLKKEKWKNFRKNIISLRLNKHEIIISIFGKQILCKNL